MSGGTKPYTTFSISGFSAGTTGLTAANLTTDAVAGTVVLSGTPTAAGTASFTVDVIDTAGATLSQELHADGQSWAEYCAGGAGRGHRSDGDQPDHHGVGRRQALHDVQHLRLQCRHDRADGRDLTTMQWRGRWSLSGTPTAAGTASFTVDVTDTAGATLTKTYSLTVNPALAIAPAALVEATPGTATSQTITVSGGTKPYTTLSISVSVPARPG